MSGIRSFELAMRFSLHSLQNNANVNLDVLHVTLLTIQYCQSKVEHLGAPRGPSHVPRATLRGVAELHVASGMPQWRMFVTSCYF